MIRAKDAAHMADQSIPKDHKRCSSCGEVKPRTEFYRTPYGEHGKCKRCFCKDHYARKKAQPWSQERKTWASAKDRCYCQTNQSYANYGGRGITMSDEWRGSFDTFLADMGPRSPGHSLDRIDNNGPYSKDNCRWAPQIVQVNNKRTNRRLTANGVTKTMAQWARELGVAPETILCRLQAGQSEQEAVTAPSRGYRHWDIPLEVHLAKTGLSVESFYRRLRTGWTLERALVTPPGKQGRRKHS